LAAHVALMETEKTMNLDELLAALADALRTRGWMMATAESCTGGLVAGACTSLAGSSDWFDRGFVTYSNDAKTDLLGVDHGLIRQHGAVSEEVARAMAAGALAHSKAQLVLAITGIAGPGGGSPGKPVGTVWFGYGLRHPSLRPSGFGALGALAARVRHHGGDVMIDAQCEQFDGDRAHVRAAAVWHGLNGLLQRVVRA
jgi:nicotinamide-nucleotide amidase